MCADPEMMRCLAAELREEIAARKARRAQTSDAPRALRPAALAIPVAALAVFAALYF